jgi:hypothetical protein
MPPAVTQAIASNRTVRDSIGLLPAAPAGVVRGPALGDIANLPPRPVAAEPARRGAEAGAMGGRDIVPARAPVESRVSTPAMAPASGPREDGGRMQPASPAAAPAKPASSGSRERQVP